MQPRTEAQGHYALAIDNKKLVFGLGPAGTGKTFVCTAMAAEALHNHEIERLILTRPAVEAGEHLGFLPGELEEKFDPFMAPFREVLYQKLGRGPTDYMINHEIIETIPLAYMRGRTFRNAWVILDEAQNTTIEQMFMFLTRHGENCKMIVNGDESQSDLHLKCNGLTDAADRLQKYGNVGVVRFEKDDVVRSGLAREIIEAYER